MNNAIEKNIVPNSIISWLLEGEPWVRYRTRIDFLGQSEESKEVIKDKSDFLNHPEIKQIVSEVNKWPGQVLNSHKSANNSYHKLAFLADLGINKEHIGIAAIAEKIMDHQSFEGPFQLITNVPKHFGGSGEDTWAWALCDAPVLVYILARLGYSNDSRVVKVAEFLRKLNTKNGYSCVVSKELGKFRGPGRKDDPCPYATLVMMKALSAVPSIVSYNEVDLCAKSLLNLWENSSNFHPYMFYMGNDFRKLKLPLIWYDLIHVLSVLSRIQSIRYDDRFNQMVNLLKSKADSDGKFTPESIYQTWKGWDFGQKKESSRLLTLFAYKILIETDRN